MNDVRDINLDLMQRYVSICNAALLKNSARFPFKQILAAAEKNGKGRPVDVAIIDQPDSDHYAITLAEGRIKAEKQKMQINHCDQAQWRVKQSYLDDVVRNAPVYIENPARLDWEWLYK